MPETIEQLLKKDIVPDLTFEEILERHRSQADEIWNPQIYGGSIEGATFKTSASGARVIMLPAEDPTVGFQIIDDAGLDVFKAIIGGTDVGDVIIGDFANDKGMKWDKSATTFTVAGTISAGTIQSDVLLVATASGTIEARVNAPFNKFYLLGNQGDGLVTSGIGTHTESRDWDRTRLSSTSAAGEYSRLTGGGGKIYNFGTDCELSIEVKFSATSNQVSFWGINGRDTPNMDSDGEFAGRQIGFVIDTAGKLYATHGNGSTQIKTEITGITITNYNRYRFVFDQGTDIKFYVNETLEATHTTNLPAAVTTYGPDFMTMDFGNSAKNMDFFNSYLVVFTKP